MFTAYDTRSSGTLSMCHTWQLVVKVLDTERARSKYILVRSEIPGISWVLRGTSGELTDLGYVLQ